MPRDGAVPPCGSRLRAVAALLCLLASRAPAQIGAIAGGYFEASQSGQPLPAGTVDHLHGVVLNSLTGKPVPRVLVTSFDNRLAVLTDVDGRFVFDLRRPVASQPASQAPQPYLSAIRNLQTTTLNLRKPGFVTRQAPVNLPFYTPSTPEPEIRLTLTPAALITGHITPDRGSLPPNLFVQLQHRQIANGAATWVQTGGAAAGASGDFRFPELAPGDYRIVAQAFPPRVNTRQTSTQNSTRNSAPSPSGDGFLPVSYPVADTPGASESVHLAAGDVVTADLALHSAPFFHIIIPFAASDITGANVAMEPQTFNQALTYSQRTHAIEGYLPSGVYQVRLATGNMPRSVATVPLTVNSAPLVLQPVALHPSADLPVIIRRDFTATGDDQENPYGRFNMPNQQQMPLAMINLQPIDGNGQPASTQPPKSGADPTQTTIANVVEGVYRVDVIAFGGYPASLTSGVTDLLREPLVVGPGGVTQPIELTLRNDGAKLSATLQPSAPPAPATPDAQPETQPNALIVALSLDQPNRQPAIGFYSPFNTNHTTFPSLAPGSYLVLAEAQNNFRQFDLEYKNPKVLEHLTRLGVVVNLSAGQTAQITVPLMPAAETGEQP